ncbi:Defense-related protein containing SCP domain [Plasmopara halstedii]|uniref:Defense-related protein containing SCP domain n=1 Tax=Plasmopara halstedii TaxID=4781 RepID=A0A0P1ADK1_PLAHL|nr:Defense-related protein containing SCP domain [Plasmopara halstedii]CEG38433.1 Defense-related protein containing SCP domain [Plasmopara halstedii]|eukprot:XP_024574802.1 Defense-related protein containing SCP domain [Plasmopara halstedii]
MKTLILYAAIVVLVRAEIYTEPHQAIWIDRHNYFRTTGLPWSASNMLQMKWDAELATKADATAVTCSATTGKGLNVFQSSSTDVSTAIDEAIQQWVVDTAMTTIKSMPQPSSTGLDVGVGYYNSYSQVVWAETTNVGCASATCSGGQMVVCAYSPAGNNENSPWYKHASQASECPTGTMASHALCIKEGDDPNSHLPAIPPGRLTYEIYPAFVADIHALLINSSRDFANGELILTSKPMSSSATSSISKNIPATTPEVKSGNSIVPSKTTETTTSPSLTKDEDEVPGKVRASFDEPSANSPEIQEVSTAEAATSKSKESHEVAHELTISGIIGMHAIGVLAVAGILLLVRCQETVEESED